jgi:hypothetical protein
LNKGGDFVLRQALAIHFRVDQPGQTVIRGHHSPYSAISSVTRKNSADATAA